MVSNLVAKVEEETPAQGAIRYWGTGAFYGEEKDEAEEIYSLKLNLMLCAQLKPLRAGTWLGLRHGVAPSFLSLIYRDRVCKSWLYLQSIDLLT